MNLIKCYKNIKFTPININIQHSIKYKIILIFNTLFINNNYI